MQAPRSVEFVTATVAAPHVPPSDLRGVYLAVTGTQLYLGVFSPCLLPRLWEGSPATARVHTRSVTPEEMMEEGMPGPDLTKDFRRRCINAPALLPPEQGNTPILHHFLAFPHGNNLSSPILTAGLKTERSRVTANGRSVGSEATLKWSAGRGRGS